MGQGLLAGQSDSLAKQMFISISECCCEAIRLHYPKHPNYAGARATLGKAGGTCAALTNPLRAKMSASEPTEPAVTLGKVYFGGDTFKGTQISISLTGGVRMKRRELNASGGGVPLRCAMATVAPGLQPEIRVLSY